MKRINDIKKWERCEKMLWLSKKEPQPFVPFVFYNEDMYSLCKQKLHVLSHFEGSVGDTNDAFFQNEKNESFFFKVRFTYENLRIRIPIMEKYKDGYRLYFTYASCFPKESEAQSIADRR